MSSDFFPGSGSDQASTLRTGGNVRSGRKTVLHGEKRVTLECAVADSQPIGIRWTLNGISVDNSSRRHQIGSSLYFSRIDKEEDTGDFACVATNAAGHAITSSPISLRVECKCWIFENFENNLLFLHLGTALS